MRKINLKKSVALALACSSLLMACACEDTATQAPNETGFTSDAVLYEEGMSYETTQKNTPKAYASLINAAPTNPSQTLVGATEGDRDAVMRLVYLVLGFAIVCILTDFLLLRKKEEDDE